MLASIESMRILFLHHNYPGQFRYVAQWLAKEGHEVVFLNETNYVGEIKGIQSITIEINSDITNSTIHGQLRCAERYRCALENLSTEGFNPDFIVSHSGWGCGVHAKAVFPRAKLISYLEWWFKDNSDEYSFDSQNKSYKYSPKLKNKLRLRNLTAAFELSNADAIVSPSKWQASQLPHIFREKTKIIHEGVDTSYFKSNNKWKKESHTVITYATRGMELMRGFPEFVMATSEILSKNKNVKVYIAGQDKIFYGGNPPKEGSFGKWAKKTYEQNGVIDNVKFLGLLPTKSYARMLKMSDIHCYFTRPFVASWSLLDAMSSGCCLVASNIEAVKEWTHAESTTYTDHTNPKDLVAKLNYLLELSRSQRIELGQKQRNHAIKNCSREKSLRLWAGLFME